MQRKMSCRAASYEAVKQKQGERRLATRPALSIRVLPTRINRSDSIMALPKTVARASEEVQLYTNSGKMPEYNLALYIVGVLAAKGIIKVSVGNKELGYECFEDAVGVVYGCLKGIAEDRGHKSANDHVFDFVMSKP